MIPEMPSDCSWALLKYVILMKAELTAVMCPNVDYSAEMSTKGLVYCVRCRR